MSSAKPHIDGIRPRVTTNSDELNHPHLRINHHVSLEPIHLNRPGRTGKHLTIFLVLYVDEAFVCSHCPSIGDVHRPVPVYNLNRKTTHTHAINDVDSTL